MEYTEWKEGEWHEPIHDGYLAGCCDCGLVHRYDFAVRKPLFGRAQVQMRVWRENDLTDKNRKDRGINVEHHN